jgi:stage V sporulation protein B
MAIPLVMFPASLLTALSTALMPAVSEAKAGGNTATVSSSVEKSLTFTAIIGIGAAALFLTLPSELGYVIYGQAEIGYMLCALGMICPFIYMQVTLSGILNGLGKQLFIFMVNLTSSLFNICVIYTLVPIYGIKAFLLGWFLSSLVTSLLSLGVITSCIKLKLYPNNILLKPSASAAIACITFKLFTLRQNISAAAPIPLICSMLLIGCIYIILVALSGAVKINKQ